MCVNYNRDTNEILREVILQIGKLIQTMNVFKQTEDWTLDSKTKDNFKNNHC